MKYVRCFIWTVKGYMMNYSYACTYPPLMFKLRMHLCFSLKQLCQYTQALFERVMHVYEKHVNYFTSISRVYYVATIEVIIYTGSNVYGEKITDFTENTH